MSFRRFKYFGGSSKLASYLHGSRIGVVVEFEGDEVAAKDVAMHIAAMKPVALASADVPADLIEKERSVAAAKAAEDAAKATAEGKPVQSDEIVAKRIEGGVQTDLKYINAYSSVSHCGLVLFAILMMNTTAGTGAILQMLSHGLMTALFFALIGMIYGRTHTRDIRELSGLMKVMPFLAVGYVIAGLANLGLPGLSGFVAEMTIFNGAFMNNDTFHRVVTIIACTSIVITAVYILRVIGRILYGTCRNEAHLKLTDATWDERLTVICLIAAIAGMGTMPLWISDMVSGSVSTIISQLMN